MAGSDRPTTAPTTVAPTTEPNDSRPTTTVGATSTTITDTTTPRTTLPPETEPPTTTTEPATTVPETKPPDDPEVTVDLRLGPVSDGQANLRWRVDGDVDAVAGWEVRMRRGDVNRRVALIRQPSVRRLRVEIPGRFVEYRVIARAADGTVIGESGWAGLPSLSDGG